MIDALQNQCNVGEFGKEKQALVFLKKAKCQYTNCHCCKQEFQTNSMNASRRKTRRNVQHPACDLVLCRIPSLAWIQFREKRRDATRRFRGVLSKQSHGYRSRTSMKLRTTCRESRDARGRVVVNGFGRNGSGELNSHERGLAQKWGESWEDTLQYEIWLTRSLRPPKYWRWWCCAHNIKTESTDGRDINDCFLPAASRIFFRKSAGDDFHEQKAHIYVFINTTALTYTVG